MVVEMSIAVIDIFEMTTMPMEPTLNLNPDEKIILHIEAEKVSQFPITIAVFLLIFILAVAHVVYLSFQTHQSILNMLTEWVELLKNFYISFKPLLIQLVEQQPNLKFYFLLLIIGFVLLFIGSRKRAREFFVFTNQRIIVIRGSATQYMDCSNMKIARVVKTSFFGAAKNIFLTGFMNNTTNNNPRSIYASYRYRGNSKPVLVEVIPHSMGISSLGQSDFYTSQKLKDLTALSTLWLCGVNPKWFPDIKTWFNQYAKITFET